MGGERKANELDFYRSSIFDLLHCSFFVLIVLVSFFDFRFELVSFSSFPLAFCFVGRRKKYFSVAERPAADNILVGIATCLFVQRADKFAIFLVESLCVRPQQIGIKIMETP